LFPGGPAPAGKHGQVRGTRIGEDRVNDSKTQREQRLAAALRANLHRRKQQARERAQSEARPDSDDTGSDAPDPAGSGGKS
jgi:hypothetical protein